MLNNKSPLTLSSSSNKRLTRLNSIENHSSLVYKSTKSISIQTDSIPTATKSTNTPNYVDQMLSEGKNMSDEQFEKFLRERALDCFWQILAERTRMQLEEQLRENQQLHQLYDESIKENERLQNKNTHCEYLNNVFHSMTSDYDSGIELHVHSESPVLKRQKTHS